MDRNQLQKKYGVIGESQALKHALDKVIQVAPTEITVLLNGETGVGKDVTARMIHDLSPRSSEKLVIVNCGAIPEGIIESELFGHEKGAYTGAHESRMGYFEQADGGTIFSMKSWTLRRRFRSSYYGSLNQVNFSALVPANNAT